MVLFLNKIRASLNNLNAFATLNKLNEKGESLFLFFRVLFGITNCGGDARSFPLVTKK